MNHRSGFTLMELLVVMGIMVLLMSISAIGFIGMRRGAEIRGAVMTVRTTMMLARQQAVTKRQNVTVQFGGDITTEKNMMTVIMGGSGVTNSVVYLPLGVGFSPLPLSIIFTPSGKASGTGKADITIKEKSGSGGAPQSKTITVWLLTGVTEAP
jgi:prepilin-type N-terminal cleavage/methylation domain-containing protein